MVTSAEGWQAGWVTIPMGTIGEDVVKRAVTSGGYLDYLFEFTGLG